MTVVKMKKPKAILFDVSDVAMKPFFVEKTLQPYFQANIKSYLEENWAKASTQDDIEAIRSEKPLFEGVPSFPPKGAEKEEVISYLCKYVALCAETKLESKGYTLLKLHVWCAAYAKGDIETSVLSDVAVQIQKFRLEQQIRIFGVFKGYAEMARRFLTHTNHGDLNQLIEGYFGEEMGPLNEAATFGKILDSMKLQAQEVLFISKSPDEYLAARASNLVALHLLMGRRQPEKGDASKVTEQIRSLVELQFE